ncbi:TPA: Ig-like domain-containing protein, partial [Photobacterium damselae]
EPASGKTDAEGKMYIFVKDSVKETVTVTASLSSSKTASSDAVSTAQVEFVNQYPCQDGSFNCLPVVESKARKGVLFTAGVSTPYMQGINYQGGYTPNVFTDDGSTGPNGFGSAGFTWQQSRDWCAYLGIKNYAGRSNWAQPSKNDFFGLYNSNGESPLGMFTAFGWPIGRIHSYWSATAYSGTSGYFNVDLGNGIQSYNYPTQALFASCISLPEADLSTAEFSVSKGLVVDTNDALSNGVAQNQVTATLTDGAGVPVTGVEVTAVITEPSLGTADSTTITYVNQVTDANGQAVIKIADSEAETVQIKVTARPGGREIESQLVSLTFKQPIFTSYPCNGVAGDFNCLPVVESKARKGVLFTAGVSTPYMQGINYQGGYTPNLYTETGSFGPNGFSSAGFTWQQGRDWCAYLGAQNYAGRSNWAQPSKDDLVGLNDTNGEPPMGMFTSYGWPTDKYYWSATASGSTYIFVNFYNGVAYPAHDLSRPIYASCVSVP